MEPQVPTVPPFTDAKVWYKSRTMVGSIVAVVALALTAAGIDLDGAFQTEIADKILEVAGLGGAVYAMVGRVLATKTLV
jgi:hypothetical protein